MTAAPSQSVTPAFEHEIRFALVMYGGVSLAIYINGVTQEFLHLVKATAVDANGDLLASGPLSGTEAVYRKLASIVRLGDAGHPDGTLRTRFIVDIASGTSAGGINAIFLGKALANGRTLDQLSRLWLDKGDLKDLLNDVAGPDGRQFAQDPPKSLLSSRGMYSKILDAFMDMDDPGQPPTPLQPEMDVFITATDIQGLELPIELADKQVFERRHKNVFHLRFATKEDGSYDVNHFTPELNAFLAFAARATSSFPFAFEPMRLASLDGVVSQNHDGAALWDSGTDALKDFFPDYVSSSSDGGYKKRSFGDGGYLDNKPFSYAINTLSRRTTDLPMQRKLVYIEPSPDKREGNEVASPPNFIQNALAATVTLHQYETIREDLQRVLDRNRLIERVQEVTAHVKEDIQQWLEQRNQQSRPQFVSRVPGPEYEKRTIADEIYDRGPSYATYYRLKVRAVTDDLAGIITRAAELLEASDEFRGIRYIIGEWRRQTYRESDATSSESAFLLAFDLSYRQRRLRFLLTKLDEQSASPNGAVREEIKQLKQELNQVAKTLGDLQRKTQQRGRDNFAHEAVKMLDIDPNWLRGLLSLTDSERRAEIRTYLTAATAKITAVAKAVSDEYRNVTIAAATATEACLDANNPSVTTDTGRNLRIRLRQYFDEYEYYDQVIFPIFYETDVGEAEPAEVIRISPQDAKSIIDETRPGENRRKLAGTTLFHFGAFFDRLWRSNDILWGRLDGAERIISTLLPRTSQYAQDLIKEAHLAIIREHLRPQEQAELKGLIVRALLSMPRDSRDKKARLRELLESQIHAPVDTKVDAVFTACLSDEEIYKYLKSDYEVDREFNPAYTLSVMGRATEIVGKMLEDVAKGASSDRVRGAVAKPAAWIARLGSIFWAIVQVAVPGGLGNKLFHHWLKILYAFEILLLIGSTLAVSAPTQQFAVTALILTAGTHLLATVLGDVMRSKHWIFRLPVFLLVVLLLVLAGLGAWTLQREIVPWLQSVINEYLPWAHLVQ